MPLLGIRERVGKSSVWKRFSEFIQRGNIIDLGVGLVIGGAFSKVLTSFVDDILSPPLGLVISGHNLENWFIVIRPGKTPGKKYNTIEDAQEDGAVTENVGRFLQTVLNFLLVAITLFIIVMAVHSFREYRKKGKLSENGEVDATKPEPTPASGATRTCPWCDANVPIKAVKCMYCTSFLHEKVPAALLNKQPQESLIELDG
ncbi:hypothetical protein BX616_002024 [Lobosporangium transversale]|uniref:Large-conductance mechanosensitive channel n=1 Tax=Lobosporangium transversale TaxID=64571 RepID=A0A1Y2GCA5_9FUNG|nr:large-conductance mechanosensitive channel [Lobosporangium transversale]KAF9902143.1 hypothetical protein BX616_002024 [Lobosporangium transversale]ORZ06827.1 large-conductance mechanosensitive channel [Lobosporangium transversale]|eukprot:XP_021877748.1 large-conductance mechanosensitive channel [Lobosporangium transversale]